MTSGRIVPSATATIEMSALPPLLLSALIRWSNAMRLPSGDQLNCPTVNAPLVSRRTLLLRDVDDPEVRHPVVLADDVELAECLLAFLQSPSDFGSLEVKAIDVPSGDHAKPPTPSSIEVSFRLSPPRGSIR